MGEVFAGRYELLDPLAAGGMGTVWRIRDRADGEVKAAKILRQSDAASLLRFVREQSMRIDHAHVVTPLSWAGMDEQVLFTMPLVRGGSLADLVRAEGALPTGWVVTLLDQLLRALEVVHAAGIVHRDVKPANLLLDPTSPTTGPHLRLTDFGIAVPVDEPRMTRASVVIGTPGYMAPEQWHGADPDPRADLYAAGRVALELLTGRRPDADRAGPGYDDLASGMPARDALARIVVALTAPDVEHRTASAAAAREQLRRRGLLDLPLEPDIVVPDRVAGLPSSPPPSSPPPSSPPPPSPPPQGPPATSPTRAGTRERPAATATVLEQPGPTSVHPRSAPGSRLPGVALLLVGIVGLALAAWLLLG